MSRPLPLFPLSTALVPGLVMPLHIFEDRYRTLIEDLLSKPDEADREFGIIAIRDGMNIDAHGASALFEVGTTAVLREADRYDDGRFDIRTTGTRRFRLLSIDTAAPLITAAVDFLDEPLGEFDPELVQQVGRLFAIYRAILGGTLDEQDTDSADLPSDPTVLSYLITAAMVLLAEERQGLLAATDTRERLRGARSLLTRENALISAFGALPAIDLTATAPSPN